MVGIKKIFAIIGIFIPFFAIFLMSQNTFAISETYSTANVDFYAGEQYQSTVNLPWNVNPSTHRFFLNNAYFNNTSYSGYKLAYINGRMVMEINPKTTTDFFVCGRDISYTWGSSASSYCLGSMTVTYSDSTSTSQTNIPVYFNEIQSPLTYNLFFDFNKELDATKTISFIQFRFYATTGYDVISRNTNWNNTTLMVLVEGRSSISVYETPPSGVDIANDLLQQQVAQNQYQIDKETQAENNISNQTTDDIDGATNQQTTNIIGIISNFITTISGLDTSRTSCNISLPFPAFAGGQQNVNVCTGKNYWTGYSIIGSGNNFFNIIGRLMLICFFVPICFILLKLIYKEIRSWTNG